MSTRTDINGVEMKSESLSVVFPYIVHVWVFFVLNSFVF